MAVLEADSLREEMLETEAASQVWFIIHFWYWALKVLVYSDEEAINKNVMVAETIGKL